MWWELNRERVMVGTLLVLTAVLYMVNPAVNDWANSYYSAAAQAGAQDWTAFLYGSSDAGNTITVDKPPAALWPIALSVRIFGLNAASIMLPQALVGVATVGVLYATVRRGFPAATALVAAGLAAVTPVATLMFRYNNPDALLVLLISLATYFTVRGIDRPRVGWMLLAGASLGLGFLAKELQAFLVVPALVGTYLFAAPVTLTRRLAHLLAALGALVISAGWWVALIQLVPASARPWVGGSRTNSFLDVVLGYNGIGRLTGSGFGNAHSSSAGIDRLLSGYLASQIGWLLPAALVLLVAALVLLGRGDRTSVPRAIVLVLGGGLVVTTAALSFMSGIFHSYYTLVMVPSIAGLVAIGATLLWRQRQAPRSRIVLAVCIAGSAAWAFAILGRNPLIAGLDWIVLILGVGSALAIAFPPRGRRASLVALSIAVASLSLGQVVYSIQTTTVRHTGSNPVAGAAASDRVSPNAISSAAGAALGAGGEGYRWVAAALGSTRAAEIQLATGRPVIALGGYKRTDPSLTLEQFQALVAARQVRYFIAGSTGGSTESARIAQWVDINFALGTVGGVNVYDLTSTPSPHTPSTTATGATSL